MLKMLYCFICFSIVSENTHAQSTSLPIPRNYLSAYAEGSRSRDGLPGPHYWQNHVDYNLSISFDPKTLLLKGNETITYFNDSPDTLDQLIFHLYPDIYKRGAMRDYPIDESDEGDGVIIEKMKIGEESVMADNRGNRIKRSGTNLTVYLSRSIMPRTNITIEVAWHYTVNKGSHLRTGAVDSTSFFLAYTFPRIAVYDDIDGWDDWNYNGVNEFYNDWGNFEATITAPQGYLVWATGELQNASEVYDARILKKYEEAMISDKVMYIVDSSDYATRAITVRTDQVSWKFSARDVTDFAFALSNHFLWAGSSVVADKVTGRRVFVDAAYNKDSNDFYEVPEVARRCVEIMSSTYPAVPFPFPHITIFNGLDQMEYPMMVNDNSTESREEMVQLTSHEIIHSYFPFYLGINETKYAWMDEGWATIGESVISPMMGEPESEGIYMRIAYEYMAGTDNEVPIITNTKLITGGTYFTNSYGKAGLFYWSLQQLLGDDLFLKALHEYINQWHGKHPTPYDFLFIFNKASGEDLSWFYKPWLFETGYPDLGLKSAEKEKTGKKGNKQAWKITVTQNGTMPLPVTLDLVLDNDSIIKVRESPAVWKTGTKEVTLQKEISGMLKEIRLSNNFIPDVDRSNNLWRAQ